MYDLIIQPNKMTYARYDYTAIQKNIIYLTQANLQNYLTAHKEKLTLDLFNDYVITLQIKDLLRNAGQGYSFIIDAVKDLMKKPIEYEYVKDKDKYSVVTTIVNTVKHKHGSGIVKLTISKDAVPFLLHVGGGYTAYQRTIVMSFRSVYSKRMYEICSRWKDKGGFSISLKEFRQMLSITDKYRQIGQLKMRVLNIAQKELKKSSDIWFDYEFKKINSRSFNVIDFKIHSQGTKSDNDGLDSGFYIFIYNFMSMAYSQSTDKLKNICDKISDNEQLEEFYRKMKRLERELNSNEKTQKDVIKIIHTIVKQDIK